MIGVCFPLAVGVRLLPGHEHAPANAQMGVAMNRKSLWIVGLVAIVLVIALPVALFWPRTQATAAKSSDPWDGVPVHATHTEHTSIITGTFDSPQEVTQACLECHPDAAGEVMHTTHWTWESEPMTSPWRDEPVTIGKKNQINNFCIGTQGNWKQCTTCHAGYGWADANFDFAEPRTWTAWPATPTRLPTPRATTACPAEGIDLLAAAKSVRMPTRENCGKCHFDGGGGNNVKHGDLDESLLLPLRRAWTCTWASTTSSAPTATRPTTTRSKASCWPTTTPSTPRSRWPAPTATMPSA